MDTELLLNQAVTHRIEHQCSAHPYEHAPKLAETVAHYSAQNILEIGTGMGYTAAVMAKVSPKIHIDTLEKDSEHIEIAKQFWTKNGVAEQIEPIVAQAESVLQDIHNLYDLIFFDGYQVHYEFLPHYRRLLKPNGILFLANNHLKSKTSDQFFSELTNSGEWDILERFEDTTIAQKNSNDVV